MCYPTRAEEGSRRILGEERTDRVGPVTNRCERSHEVNDKNMLTPDEEQWYIPDEDEDDRAHLLEVLENVQSDLNVFWQAAAPLLRRGTTRELAKALNLNFLLACDGVTHSVEWLRRMPPRADDGTHVWEPLPEAAVTNEPEVRSDEMGGREADSDGERRGRQERDSIPHGAGTSDPERQLRIAKWQAREAQRKLQAAKGTRRRTPPRARKGKR